MRFKDENGGEWESITTQSDDVMVLCKRETNRMPKLKPGMSVRFFPDTWRIVSEVGEDYFRYWYRENEEVSIPQAVTGILAIRDCGGELIWERDK